MLIPVNEIAFVVVLLFLFLLGLLRHGVRHVGFLLLVKRVLHLQLHLLLEWEHTHDSLLRVGHMQTETVWQALLEVA